MAPEVTNAVRDTARMPAAGPVADARLGSRLGAAPQFDPTGLGQALSMLDPTLRANVLAHVQRAAGNQSALRLIAAPTVQRCTTHSICPECAARQEAAGGDKAVQGDFVDDAKAAGAGALSGLSAAAKEVLHILSCIPLLRAIAIVTTASEEALVMLAQHAKAFTMPTAAEAQLLLPLVEKVLITSVCNCLPDKVVTAIALHLYLAGQPLAQKHLQHYLTGGGADFKEDINDLFTRNPTIRNNVGNAVGFESQGGKTRSGTLQGGADLPGGGQAPGFPPITQDDYDDQDWRNSIGNVDRLDWTILSGPDATGNATVRITLADPYAWHPKEARLTQCVHQAIENMKTQGAQEYMARGTGDVVLNLGSAFKPGPNAGPR